MTLRQVKFGIIGTGAIAAVHARAIQQNPQAQLCWVYDENRERAEQFGASHHCRVATTLEELLVSDVEAVTIATPSGRHAEIVIPAARAGKHILCEKPLEVTVEKVDAMLRECDCAGVLFSAVFQSRFSRNVRRIRQAVAAGRFGRPVFGAAAMFWYRSPEYYAGATWRGTWELDGGGALMNQGIHTVDLLLHFNGNVVETTARATRRLHENIAVEDTIAALLRFENGSLGTLMISTACAPGFPRRIELVGTAGSVILEEDRLVRWSFARETPEDEEIRRDGIRGEGIIGGAADPGALSCEGHSRQIRDLTDAILNRSPLAIPGREGRRAVALITGCYTSAATGKTVFLGRDFT